MEQIVDERSRTVVGNECTYISNRRQSQPQQTGTQAQQAGDDALALLVSVGVYICVNVN